LEGTTPNSGSKLKRWLIVSALLLSAVLSVLPVVDNQASANYEKLFQRAFVTFALARTLNGVISAAQGTELALQPAGVGVTLTPGQILDPVNDLVERFSWIMLGATVSLGIQDVLMDVSAFWLIKGFAVVMAVWLLLAFFARKTSQGSQRILIRIFLVAMFLRFAVPLTLIANDAIYDLFLEKRYNESTALVSTAGKDIEHIGQSDAADLVGAGSSDSFGSGFLNTMTKTKDAMNFGQKVDRIKSRAAEMIEHLIQLAVVFILQTGILPLVFLWLFLQSGKWIFRSEN
jgi:hypothetical protein